MSIYIVVYTVKQFIIGHDLFGEIGEFKKFAKIYIRRQIKTSPFLDSPVLEISKLIPCQIVIFEKPPNKISAKYSRFTVVYIYIYI